MDPYPSFKSTSVVATISKIACTTSAGQAVAFFTGNEKANAGRKATVTRVTEAPADKMKDRYTLPRLPFSLQRMRKNHNGLDFLPFLYVKLLSQLAGL